ncbi:11435_t:CDS:2 [Paraglomus brasilianum]|uniref:11435_t:CDS:1 n=1 Tax=Paraglomus brasilianum TaxID=144538 RepID=A0A9N9AMW3_9GLOM|nr:11435_t:CDS:2 [Paraglomus brasilianum]
MLISLKATSGKYIREQKFGAIELDDDLIPIGEYFNEELASKHRTTAHHHWKKKTGKLGCK